MVCDGCACSGEGIDEFLEIQVYVGDRKEGNSIHGEVGSGCE